MVVSTRGNQNIKQGKRIESARETALVLKMVKIPSWEGDIRWGSPSGTWLREEYLESI